MANPENIAGQGFHTNPERINLAGKAKGTRNRQTIYREHLEKMGRNGQIVDDLVLAAIDKALVGDITALKELMDSGYGKTPDKQEVTGKDGGPVETRAVPDTSGFIENIAGMGPVPSPEKPSQE